MVLGPKPPAHATKRQWSEYAVEHGMTEAEVEALTRDQLAEKYRDEPGT